jgi:predicted nucleic acid-binding protein
MKKVRLVIDTGVFIPCGDKSEEMIESIKKFGNELPKIAEKLNITILLSTEVLNEYRCKIRPNLKSEDCHPLPKFHSDFTRSLDRICRLSRSHRKCREVPIGLFKFHVVESSKIDKYTVKEFIDDEDDEKFLRLALSVAKGGLVCIVSVDTGSILRLRDDENAYLRFCKRYDEAKNILILRPHEFVELLEESL